MNELLEAAKSGKEDSEERYNKLKKEEAGTKDKDLAKQRYEELKEKAKNDYIEKEKKREQEALEKEKEDEDEDPGFVTY